MQIIFDFNLLEMVLKKNIMSLKTNAIILAAGSGNRMQNNIPKQFLLLNNKPIIIHTLEKFARSNLINKIILVCNQDYISYCKKLVLEYNFKKNYKIIPGGKERFNSVYNALEYINSKIICIHDAVRPFVSLKIIQETIYNSRHNAGCICAIKSHDSIKKINKSLKQEIFVNKSLDREDIYLIQTPQSFKTKLIKKFYASALRENFAGTDDSSFLEKYNQKIKIIHGDNLNFKITTQQDLVLANLYYKYLNT